MFQTLGTIKQQNGFNLVIPELNVHVTTAYRSSHLDSTILPLKEGLVLLNGARVNSDNVPPFLTDWDKIFFNDPAPVCEKEIYFFNKHRKPIYEQLVEMGAESPIGHISSPWAGLNVLSINQDTVLVHDRQTSLIRTLERQNLNVVPIQMRHCYTMLGGLHCVTLDVERAKIKTIDLGNKAHRYPIKVKEIRVNAQNLDHGLVDLLQKILSLNSI